jgi:hypothetical protein
MIDITSSLSNRQIHRALTMLCRTLAPSQICEYVAAAARAAARELGPVEGKLHAGFALRIEAIGRDEEREELGAFQAAMEPTRVANRETNIPTPLREFIPELPRGARIATPKQTFRVAPQEEIVHRIIINEPEPEPMTTRYSPRPLAPQFLPRPHEHKTVKTMAHYKTIKDEIIDLSSNDLDYDEDTPTDPCIRTPMFG